MNIEDLKSLEVGERVVWTAEPRAEGTVVARYPGAAAIRWDDNRFCNILFRSSGVPAFIANIERLSKPFSALPVGVKFDFVRDPKHLNLAVGPWVKISSRQYQPVLGENDKRPAITCKVGSVNVRVQEVK